MRGFRGFCTARCGQGTGWNLWTAIYTRVENLRVVFDGYRRPEFRNDWTYLMAGLGLANDS